MQNWLSGQRAVVTGLKAWLLYSRMSTQVLHVGKSCVDFYRPAFITLSLTGLKARMSQYRKNCVEVPLYSGIEQDITIIVPNLHIGRSCVDALHSQPCLSLYVLITKSCFYIVLYDRLNMLNCQPYYRQCSEPNYSCDTLEHDHSVKFIPINRCITFSLTCKK